MSTKKTCQNCGKGTNGNYCHHCGQKLNIGRFTVKSIFHAALDAFDFEKGFLSTIKGLAFTPGKTINAYLKGGTASFYNPLKYMIFLVGISTLLLTNFMDFDSFSEALGHKPGQDGSEAQVFANTWVSFIKQNMNVMAAFQVPFLALASFWVFRKKKLYYAEHLIAHCFLAGQTSLITVLVFLVLIPFGAASVQWESLRMVLALVYFIWATATVFSERLSLAHVVKSVLVWFLGFFLFMLSIIPVAWGAFFLMKKLGFINV